MPKNLTMHHCSDRNKQFSSSHSHCALCTCKTVICRFLSLDHSGPTVLTLERVDRFFQCPCCEKCLNKDQNMKVSFVFWVTSISWSFTLIQEHANTCNSVLGTHLKPPEPIRQLPETVLSINWADMWMICWRKFNCFSESLDECGDKFSLLPEDDNWYVQLCPASHCVWRSWSVEPGFTSMTSCWSPLAS